ncbi:hypothetical protein [Vibrio panuliri]|uniref:Exonuclease V subunit gamma n=1 Tax=Vibrio panuliri TaxID=1381081 RepID=A0A1Q9HP46_9VIBR|nr:hypothetical protein [Vibrio panuliri]KAB1455164.1 hypothetical protein F7O85_20200 [Vibrio panuliri]OLQ91834.1 hypothetical protein BIY20_09430 [Vibrio panuliri]OLQ92611.1 hypothetical protein BIY22_14885 [Vibrio panuliri]
MKTVICNSLQSFWDMAENELLTNLSVHCVFPVSDSLKNFILTHQAEYKIHSISFTSVFN